MEHSLPAGSVFIAPAPLDEGEVEGDGKCEGMDVEVEVQPGQGEGEGSSEVWGNPGKGVEEEKGEASSTPQGRRPVVSAQCSVGRPVQQSTFEHVFLFHAYE